MDFYNISRQLGRLMTKSWSLSLSVVIYLSLSSASYAQVVTNYNIPSNAAIGTISLDVAYLGNGTLSNPSALMLGSNTFNYLAPYFTVSQSGSYSFGQSSAPLDTVMVLYSGSFDPAHPGTNAVAGNDDYLISIPQGITLQTCNVMQNCPALSAPLVAGVTYYMFISSFGSSEANLFQLPQSFWCYGPSSCVFGLFGQGPNAINTSLAMVANQNALRSLLSQRSSAMMNMMDYDCSTFDAKGYCVSFRARYTAMDSQNEGAGVFTAAYRASEKVRIGGFIDYRASEMDSAGLKNADTLPTIGAFAAYSHRGDATGFQAKASAAYNTGKVTVTRVGSVADNTEAGSGKTGLSSYAVGAELGWGFAVSPTMLATPYAGVRYSDATRNSYTEGTVAGIVAFPISYDAYYQRLTTATAGVRLTGMLSDKVGYQASLGGEYDLAHKPSTYSGASAISGLETFALANTGSSNRARVVASTGVYYQLDKTQRLTATVGVRGQAYSSQPSVTTLVGYQVAF